MTRPESLHHVHVAARLKRRPTQVGAAKQRGTAAITSMQAHWDCQE